MKIKIFLVVIIIVSIVGAYYFYNNREPIVEVENTVIEKHLDSQGLEWTDDIPGLNGYVNLNTNRSYCDNLSSVDGLKPNISWRVPTKDELLRLYKEAQSDKSIKLNSIGYWSSENYNNDIKMETVVSGDFESTGGSGYFGSSKGVSSYFGGRCVR